MSQYRRSNDILVWVIPPIYILQDWPGLYLGCFDMLKNLTETTRRCLHQVEGDLWVPWAAAQQINAQQKVNFSIECVSRIIFDC